MFRESRPLAENFSIPRKKLSIEDAESFYRGALRNMILDVVDDEIIPKAKEILKADPSEAKKIVNKIFNLLIGEKSRFKNKLYRFAEEYDTYDTVKASKGGVEASEVSSESTEEEEEEEAADSDASDEV